MKNEKSQNFRQFYEEKTMKLRFITAVGIAVIGLPLLIFSQYISFQIALAALCVIAMFELLGVLSLRRNLALAIPAYIIAAAVPFSTYFVNNDWQSKYILLLCLVLFAYMTWAFAVAVFKRGSLKFGDVAAVFVLLTYVTVAFTSLGLIRKMGDGGQGALYLGLIFTAAFTTDVFAYFTGYFFGRHKLIPEVSPKKTVEGSIGGIVFAAIGFLVYGFIVDLVGAYEVNYPVLILSGLLLSVISQIGDLIASLVKREHGIKDYGFIFPGHGGVMDRFDSVIAVCAPTMIICMLFPPFV